MKPGQTIKYDAEEYAKVAQWREKPGCSMNMEAWKTMFQ